MLNTQTPPPKQVLLRLPEDLAAQLARSVPPRQRNRYIVGLLQQDLQTKLAAKQETQSRMLAAAAQRMNELEAQHPELAQETAEWANAQLTESVDAWDPGFDRASFEREWALAQTARPAAKTGT